MKQCLCFLFIFQAFNLISQEITDTLQLYFAINESYSEPNFRKIDSAFKSGEGRSVRIYGYADYLHSDGYNLKLSEKRANLVAEHIRKNHPHLKIIETRGIGEKFSEENKAGQGDRRQRRVDIIYSVSQKNIKKPIAKIPPATHAPAKKIETLKKGESAALEGLSFIPGRHTIMKSSEPVLKKLLETLNKHNQIKIEIQGHVCCTQGAEDGYDFDSRDKNLSLNRAKFVYDYLVENGIDPERLSYKGFAHTKPKIMVESTPEEEQINRRVEIKIIEK